MNRLTRLAVGASVALGLSAWIAPVAAGAEGFPGPHFGGGGDHVVFVQTDNTAGNQVVAYDRADTGSLTLADTYNTGGLGGVLGGSVVDHLASQGSLTYDQNNVLLYAVNAGSNTVSVFSVRGDQLTLRQVINSGGTFPVSVAVHDNIVYVLNAENGGTVQIEGLTTNFALTDPSLEALTGVTAETVTSTTDVNGLVVSSGGVTVAGKGQFVPQ